MAVKEKKSKIKPIRLDWKSVQQVVITDKDGARWVTTVKEAAQACRSALDQKEWEEQFRNFLGRVHEWAKEKAAIVLSAFVGVSAEGLTVVIVTKGKDYRTDFDDAVTDLDIDLADRFPSCRADVLQSPEEEPESRIPYLSLERAVQVYGDQN